MKAVAFVCLLLVSLSQSLPSTQPDGHPSQAVAPAHPDGVIVGTTNKTEKAVQSTTAQSTGNETQSTAKPVNNNTEKAAKTEDPKELSVKPVIPKPENHTEGAKPAETSKSAQDAPSQATTPAQNPNAAEEAKTTGETKTAGETKAAGKPEPAQSTASPQDNKPTQEIKPETEKPTVAPKDNEKPIVAARGFDGASFIGGIILTLGLLAIGFMGFKYYKNQTERNYHTL